MPGEAVEVVVRYRKTKADQAAFGACRGHFRSGDSELCPVAAFEMLRLRAPERFEGEEALKPLLRWSSGRMLRREQMQAALERAASAEGLPAARFRSHSLRIGGASALFHATNEIEIVKRYGRWNSTAFHGYLWDARDQARGLSAKMAADVASLM